MLFGSPGALTLMSRSDHTGVRRNTNSMRRSDFKDLRYQGKRKKGVAGEGGSPTSRRIDLSSQPHSVIFSFKIRANLSEMTENFGANETDPQDLSGWAGMKLNLRITQGGRVGHSSTSFH